MEAVMKKQRNAYILSKLVENKAFTEDYKDNKILIEAFDAYVDVKRILSGTPYK